MQDTNLDVIAHQPSAQEGSPSQTVSLPPLIQALMHPSAFGPSVSAVQLMETHISWVLLTGDYAYKIKKPIKLPFLDFSSLPRRQRACQDEVRLNRRFAPELYVDVVPIGGDSTHPQIAGIGPPFEYAVKMRQFPPEQQLDRLLDAGHLSRHDMEAFGCSLAALHASLPAAPMDTDSGTPPQVHAPVHDSLRDLFQGETDQALRDALRVISKWIDQRHTALSMIFLSRKLAGRVRECHGDLHLANLVKLARGVMPFDCIEFSSDLRWIDVVSDVAFLLMDLAQRGHVELSYVFLNGYLESSGDYEGIRVLHYYLVYRALVRAKVEMIRWQQAPKDQRPRHAATCTAYVHQALSWTSRTPPGLIVMHGLAGSGKTYFSRELAARLPAIRVRSDVERKRMHRIAVGEHSESALDAGIYTPAANREVYSRLETIVGHILAGGETAIVDATFIKRADRQRFAGLARQLDAPFAIVECRAPLGELERRIAKRAEENMDASEANLDVLRAQVSHYESLDVDERAHALTVDTAQPLPFEALSAQLRDLL